MVTAPASVAQSDALPTSGHNPHWVQQHSLVEIDHEIFSMVILSLPQILRRAVFSFCRKNVHKYWLTAFRTACPGKSEVR